MAKRLETIWPVEPHTLKKHQLLREYVQAWLPIVGRHHKTVLYVDGFAGPGAYSGGEDGSPLIVLKAARDHQHPTNATLQCLFVEQDHERFTHLESELAAIQPTLPHNIRAKLILGRFDERCTSDLALLKDRKEQRWPTLSFIDPFGFSHTPFNSVKDLLSVERSEVFVNFMYEEVNRFLDVPDHSADYDRLFGTEDWRQIASIKGAAKRRTAMKDLYTRQLKTVASYVNSFEMKNSNNSTDYILFFATNHLLGLEKMKDAMWRVDSTGSFVFSDFSARRGQRHLFEGVTEFPELRAQLLSHFAGKSVGIEDVEKWVLAETPFLRRHVRASALIPLEEAGSLEVTNPKQGRRSGQFPSGTILRFGY